MASLSSTSVDPCCRWETSPPTRAAGLADVADIQRFADRESMTFRKPALAPANRFARAAWSW